MGKQSDNRSSDQRSDTYSRITDKIIAELEQGVRPMAKPWSTGYTPGGVTRPRRHTGQPSSGINVLILWSEAIACGFISSRWMTFRQAIELGGAAEPSTRVSREHNDANVLVLGVDIMKPETAFECIEIFLDIKFFGGRYAERRDRLTARGGL
jgi:hypothetical protein